ncbi:MAG: aspartate aminotransferase family protein [Actinobacteria bacterium]|nr:aspartate aminotransferase family protein [Actinomycetota bacterium]
MDKYKNKLSKTANEHLYVGMFNESTLEEEGGPLIIEQADGIKLTSHDGEEFIDGISGMYFRNVGHGREEIAKAIYDQLSSVSMNVYAGVTPVSVKLAQKISKISPGDLSKTFFCQGGSEANESSLKMAQAFHVRNGDKGRFKVISRDGSYHGSTYGTMWLGGHPGFPRTDYQPAPSNLIHVKQPNYYRRENDSESPEEFTDKCLKEIEDKILFHGPDSISSFIGEPISQPLGGVVPPEDYWPMVRKLCDRYGILLIFDEVITGFGRTGEWFGADIAGVTPDIMSFAKGVTSGYFPLGGSVSTRRISSVFNGDASNAWSHMYTYSCHPGGAAAGLKNLEIVERENLVLNAKERGKQLFERLSEIKDKHRIVGDNRGIGLIQGLELVKDRDTKEHFDSSLHINRILTLKLKERGIWIRVPAFIVPVAPPLITTKDQIDHICTAIDESIDELEKELT